MTDDEMQRLASIIVDKIFERQDELDEELMAEWQLEILEQTELPNERDELNRLEEMLTKAISEDEFELAATLHKKIIKIKTK
jgi:protein-arginine kinase activator protein McsA|tara:strand:+ start:2072 stop:2317 length:246 start_codon:yes stop_codon:yes gene_type:complete